MEKDKIVFKGSHPDSLYRVPTSSGAGAGKVARALRVMRWPLALVVICVALALFVYFLMPDNLNADLEIANATFWESNIAVADTHRTPDKFKKTTQKTRIQDGIPIPEIDFDNADTNKNEFESIIETITDKNPIRKLPIPPVFPTHLTPEVQYGNEKADTDNSRTPKILNTVDSTVKPHITQKPEKPLAIYFKDGAGITTTTSTETITRAETINDFANNDEKQNAKKVETSFTKPYSNPAPWPVNRGKPVYDVEPNLPADVQEYYSEVPVNSNVNFTSGHSKLFGISIEDAKSMQSTTQSSVYNTRVSPTLPTWRDGDDTTTKKYPVNINPDEAQCHSTRLALCRGVLPYDLAGPAAVIGRKDITSLLPQIEYLASTNCSARIKHFMCALLEPECSPSPLSPKMPCYSFCRSIMDGCEGQIPHDLLPVFDCKRYSSVHCETARAPCTPSELQCGDGSCVSRDWICDGTKDCPAGEDEQACLDCGKNEFRCMESGACIQKSWLCDGYADCPDGEDEAECRGQPEPGEESAGSAPAPAVHRPNNLPGRQRTDKSGDNESSKELLIMSDSSNALKRNFTRRPSLSRLSPYTRPIVQTPPQPTADNPVTQRFIKKKNKFGTRNSSIDNKTTKQSSDDDTSPDDVELFDDGKEDAEQKKTVRTSSVPESPRAEMNMAPLEGTSFEIENTKLEKSIQKLERVLNGATFMKKSQEGQHTQEENYDSVEANSTSVRPDYSQDRNTSKGTRGSGGSYSVSAHASPCPSGELRCVDGRCITLSQLCDGVIDCSDHADEDNCFT